MASKHRYRYFVDPASWFEDSKEEPECARKSPHDPGNEGGEVSPRPKYPSDAIKRERTKNSDSSVPVITVTLPKDLLAEIDAAAEATGETRSAWIREACEEKLSK